jgi:ADP-heptose:LPS heptosyltransferase
LSILLVRLRLIGDVVFTTPVIRALRRRFPNARLVYVVEPAAAAVVEHNPHLNEIIVAPRQRAWRRLRDDVALARRLRRERFDVAIDLHGGPRSAWLTWSSGAPVRVGYDVPGRTWMYTVAVPRSRELLPRHSVENQWDLLAGVDATFAADTANPSRDRVEMWPGDRARATVDARLQNLPVDRSSQFKVLHVSAGNPIRRWPEREFAVLAAELVAAGPDRVVLVTSGPSDHDAAARVLRQARDLVGATAAHRLIDTEGLTLLELRALMDRAALFIGGDSGPLHIASTSDVPIVGLYGPTLPARSAPWRPSTIPNASVEVDGLPCRPCDQRACAPGDFRCLTTVRARDVRAKAEHVLEGRV